MTAKCRPREDCCRYYEDPTQKLNYSGLKIPIICSFACSLCSTDLGLRCSWNPHSTHSTSSMLFSTHHCNVSAVLHCGQFAPAIKRFFCFTRLYYSFSQYRRESWSLSISRLNISSSSVRASLARSSSCLSSLCCGSNSLSMVLSRR